MQVTVDVPDEVVQYIVDKFGFTPAQIQQALAVEFRKYLRPYLRGRIQDKVIEELETELQGILGPGSGTP